MLRFKQQLMLALLVRMLAVLLIELQDSHKLFSSTLTFTDIDYTVLTDAATHLRNGQSPFNRHTYRYTPLLAYLMLPNLTVSPFFGKILFCLMDILVGMLIRSIVTDSRVLPLKKTSNEEHPRWQWQRVDVCTCLWLFNPLVIAVSARGNADVIVALLVLLTLKLYHERVFILSGAMFAMAVHFKLYPIIYLPALYFSLRNGSSTTNWEDQSSIMRVLRSAWSLLWPNMARLRFLLSFIFVLASITYFMYLSYGEVFLEQTLIYHLVRRDRRHNFSVYFYMLYLTEDIDDVGLALIAFIPQLVVLITLSLVFGSSRRHLHFALFTLTVVLVTYNKVVTSQYFLWYISLLPISNVPLLKFSGHEILAIIVIWLSTQASWLLPAYYLEFKGVNTFFVIWMEGLAFFTGNVGLLSKIIRKYKETMSKVEFKKKQERQDIPIRNQGQ